MSTSGSKIIVIEESGSYLHQSLSSNQYILMKKNYSRNWRDSIWSRFSNPSRNNSTEQLSQLQIKRKKYIGYWLLTCAGLTFVTVCVGGITRLTESGLSMVDWHPFKEVPPFNEKQWQEEFEKYKQFPEFKVKNKDITLNQFKSIWYMEYFHRMLGRTIGSVYFIPAAIFWAMKWFDRGTKIRVGIFGTLLGFQGFLGWYMVKSGLTEKEVYTHEPRVSQYRLAAHLGTAFVFYSLIFYNALVNLIPVESMLPITKQLLRFKLMIGYSKMMIFFTALSGAFVAGLDAGLVYNSWPKMADRWIPSDLLRQQPLWKNFFENPTCVQFNHRHLGEITGTLVLGLWAYSLRLKLPKRARLATNLLALAMVAQITLGVTALLQYVPIEIASAHQANALLTLSLALWLSKELRWVKRIAK
ncbi:Cytochrome c oxidase assembly protein COX15 -like protein [Sarcoptes scabiei]|uniref:Cytochrome c oxidase assembly protein COX15 -like protein n=1 Tax=Sarcoptes scabiei TaxID=52283 RepID=A0A834RDM4_SARSC|nr:Cytochrome c oxidase assembly protein COX15 -like protein [Sarcoptes scabiei]